MAFTDKIKSGFKQASDKLLHPAKPSERKYSLLSFFLPFILLLLAYFVAGLFPIGNNSPLSYDLNAQYSHFFAGLKNMLSDGESILYSWSRTLGGEYFGMVAYYLLSPFNLLIFILPMSLLETSILLTILGKTGLMGLAMYYYLRRGISLDRQCSLLFSLTYALCSYSVTYGSNIMWLDALIILPLLVWGIERLIDDKKSGLYVFSIAYAMITNYYMGFMLCILTVLYFFVYRFGRFADTHSTQNNEKADTFPRQLVRIGVYTVIALAISAVVLLPAYRSLSFGKTEFTVPNFVPRQDADFLAVLKKTLIGSYDSMSIGGIAFIYSGMLTLLLAPVYFLSKAFGKREKLANGLLLAFIFSGFIISTVDLLWHGFQYPNALNYRYAFIFSFFVCKLAAQAYSTREQTPQNSLYGIFAVIILAIFCIQAQYYLFGSDIACVWVSLGVLAVYFAMIKFMSGSEKRRYLSTALTAVVCIELFAASALSLVDYDSEIYYSKHGELEDYIDKYSAYVEAIKKENSGFYRVERVGNRLTNDPLSLGIKGISGSTSTLNSAVIELMEQIGYGGNSNFASYLSVSPVADSIFGIRYLICDTPIDSGVFKLNEQLTSASDEEVYIYENPLSLPVAFSANAAVNLCDTKKYRTPFEANNALVSALTGTELAPYSSIKITRMQHSGIFTSVKDGHTHFTPTAPVSEDGYYSVTFTVPTEKGKPVYACFPTDNETEAEIYVDGEFAYDYDSIDGNTIQLLGSFEDGSINVEIRWNKKKLTVRNGISYFYQLDTAILEEAHHILSSNGLNVSSYSNTEINGSFSYSENLPTMYTTVPYDSDWTLYVDGKKVETVKLNGALIGADLSKLGLSEGEHTFKLTYVSSSMVKGAMISLFGILTLVGTALIKKYGLPDKLTFRITAGKRR